MMRISFHRMSGVAVALLMISVQGLSLACDPSSSSARLPYALTEATAVYTGEVAYIFGGSQTTSEGATVLSSSILMYNPSANNISELPTKLPLAVKVARSFWDGQSAWIFSGVNKTAVPMDYLVKFTPPGTIEYWEHFFPYGLKGCCVAWTGKVAYIFGNCVCTSNPGTRQNVIKFDPSTVNATVLSNVIPIELAGSTAVWDGKNVYLFAGRTPNGSGSADLDIVMKFDPAAQTCVKMNARFPAPRFGVGAVLKGGKVSVFGGECSKGQLDEVLTYDIASDRLAMSDKKLSTQLSSSSYALVGDSIVIFAAKTSGGATDSVEVVTLKAKATTPSRQPVNLVGIAFVGLALLIMVALSAYTMVRRNKKDG
jgi:hypothetical protein